MRHASSLVFHVQLVHDAMHKRRQHQRGGTDEEQPGEQGIGGGEQLSGVVRDRIDRPHAAEDHGGVQEGVDPRQATEVMVAKHADSQGGSHHHCRQSHKADDSPKESVRRQQRVGSVLKHADYRTGFLCPSRRGGPA